MSSNSSSAPRFLIADIGGTNARFALTAPDSRRGFDRDTIRVLRVADFPTPVAAALHYLAGQAVRPGGAVLAVAGPTDGETAQLTNHPWSFSADALRAAIGSPAVQLVNDFAAVARALPELGPMDWRPLGPAHTSATGTDHRTYAVLGPGTGLGVAAVTMREGRAFVLQTEGGHASFAPGNPEEIAILECLGRRYGRVSWERLLSGAGLVNIHAAVCEIAGEPVAALTPEDVTARAAGGEERASVRSVEIFCAVLGAFAGDAALLYGAWDGVFIAGGIAPALAPWLAAGGFRARFEAKGRFAGRLARVGAALVVHPFPGLLGAAGYATTMANPGGAWS